MTFEQPILLVEDDTVDVMTVKRAMRALKIATPLHVSGNGEIALEYLRDSHNPQPSMILLDINMPRMNGLELLAELKKDEALRLIPVVILTTSHEEQDRLRGFDLGVAGYMLKPVDYNQFIEIMRMIYDYWRTSLRASPPVDAPPTV